jgi:hypothetical protein
MTFKKLLLAAAAIAGLVASATLPHDASAQVGAQILALTDAYNASGWELFSSLSESPGNIVLSPYSIGSAMSMTLSGARGDTAQEMASVLKHSLSREEIDAANGQVPATLSSYDRSAVPPGLSGRHAIDRRALRGKSGCQRLVSVLDAARGRPMQGRRDLSAVRGAARGERANAAEFPVGVGGLRWAAQGQVRGRSVSECEPRRRERLGRSQDQWQDRQNPG